MLRSTCKRSHGALSERRSGQLRPPGAEKRPATAERPPGAEGRAAEPNREAQTTAPSPRLFILARAACRAPASKPTLLVRISVGASTQRSSAQRLEDFSAFARENGLALVIRADVENVVLAFMDEMFMEGLAAHHG